MRRICLRHGLGSFWRLATTGLASACVPFLGSCITSKSAFVLLTSSDAEQSGTQLQYFLASRGLMTKEHVTPWQPMAYIAAKQRLDSVSSLDSPVPSGWVPIGPQQLEYGMFSSGVSQPLLRPDSEVAVSLIVGAGLALAKESQSFTAGNGALEFELRRTSRLYLEGGLQLVYRRVGLMILMDSFLGEPVFGIVLVQQ